MSYRKTVKKDWARPVDKEAVENKIYALDLVHTIIDGELEKFEFRMKHYRDYGWLPGGKEGKNFRRKENETRILLQYIQSELEHKRKELIAYGKNFDRSGIHVD